MLSRQQLALARQGKGDNVRMVRKSTVQITASQAGAANQVYWKHHKVGDYIYSAASTGGIHVFYMDAEGNMTFVRRVRLYDENGVLTSIDVRGLCHIGDTLFVTAWRFTNITDPANIREGLIAAYDISDQAAFGNDDADRDHINTYKAIPSTVDETPAWIQDPVTDGTYIYVAAQYDGLYVYDAAALIAGTDPVHGTGMHINADWPPTYWEASNITMTPDKKHVILSNHGTGGVAVSIINIENPAAPVVSKRIDQFDAPNGDPLRVRSVHAHGKYLYCSPNSDGQYLNSEHRGLLALDLSDIPNIPEDGSSWIHERIPAHDQDNEYEDGDAGDPACVGIYGYGYHAFMTVGHSGVAVYSVRDPENPVYLGLLQTCECIQRKDIGLYHGHPVYHNGKSYLVYGSGPESVIDHVMFLDEITVY